MTIKIVYALYLHKKNYYRSSKSRIKVLKHTFYIKSFFKFSSLMPLTTLGRYLQKKKEVILCPLIGFVGLVKLIFKLIWLMLNLQWTLVKKLLTRLLPSE